MVLRTRYSDAFRPLAEIREAAEGQTDSQWPLSRFDACVLGLMVALAIVLIWQDLWVAVVATFVLSAAYAATACWLARKDSQAAETSDCHKYD